MRLTDYVTFNNNMSMAAAFLDIEKAFHTTWHLGLLYKLPKLQILANLTKLISSFLSNRNSRATVAGVLSTTQRIKAGAPQGFFLAPTLCSLYVNDASQIPEVHLALFAEDTCIYVCMYVCMYVCNRPQRRLCSRKATMRPHCNGGVMQAQEHKDQLG
jgi:hypothetical protein